ncbi:MAG: Ig-like domain-containing protein, partial [Anaerolineales bacterium]|nr:Ig-like domain-containing protein [Anaerolineales bacterium]
MLSQKPMMKSRLLPWLPLLLLLLALACAVPSFGPGEEDGQPAASAPEGTAGLAFTATPLPVPTYTPQPLPPTLLEAQPAPGSVLAQRAAMTLYFNQPMERNSVEAALSGQPPLAGNFNWLDDATVEFRSEVAFLPGSDLLVSVASTARAANGLTMLEPVELHYQVAGPMTAIQVLPAPDAQEIDPTLPVLVAFDQPVVPLGADPVGLPVPFTIEPALGGQGEWLNTSTYVFYPEPAMTGGQAYTISLNPSLQSAAGSSLSGLAEAPGVYAWSFTTAPARLVSADPADSSAGLPLDSNFQLTFSQPMDSQSVQANFGLYDPTGLAVTGEFGWDTSGLTLTFTPTQLLDRDSEYSLLLLGTARAQGGNQLGQDYAIQVQTVPALAVQNTIPAQDSLAALDRSLTITFNGPIDPRQREDYISISPRVADLYTWWSAYDNTLNLSGDFKPLSEYVVVISAGLPDPYGGRLGQEYVWRFSTGPYPANLVLQTAGQDVLLLPNESGLPAQATNLAAVDLSLGSVPLADLGRFLGSGGYEVRSGYVPADVRTWQQSLDLPGDQLYDIELSLAPDGGGLAPGVYLLRVNAPALAYAPSPYLLVSSQHHLTLKVSATQVFVWAIDLLDDTRVAGAPVRVYSPDGELLAEGLTDKDGIFQQSIGPREDAYGNFYAVMGSPGSSDFALSISSWNSGLQG